VPLSDDPLADQLLATADWTDGLSTWDPTVGEKIASMPGEKSGTVGLCAVQAGGRHLLGAGGDVLRLWDPLGGELICEHTPPEVVQDAVQVGDHIFVQLYGGYGAYRIDVEEVA
jgi:hypothetical protein